MLHTFNYIYDYTTVFVAYYWQFPTLSTLGCRAFFNYININYWGIYPSRPFACWAAHWHTYVFVLHSWDLIKNLPYSAAQSGMQFFQMHKHASAALGHLLNFAGMF
jgi:hypothetical protein